MLYYRDEINDDTNENSAANNSSGKRSNSVQIKRKTQKKAFKAKIFRSVKRSQNFLDTSRIHT